MDSHNDSHMTHLRSRLPSAFTFLAAAFSGFALALLSCLIFFFSPCVREALVVALGGILVDRYYEW